MNTAELRERGDSLRMAVGKIQPIAEDAIDATISIKTLQIIGTLRNIKDDQMKGLQQQIRSSGKEPVPTRLAGHFVLNCGIHFFSRPGISFMESSDSIDKFSGAVLYDLGTGVNIASEGLVMAHDLPPLIDNGHTRTRTWSDMYDLLEDGSAGEEVMDLMTTRLEDSNAYYDFANPVQSQELVVAGAKYAKRLYGIYHPPVVDFLNSHP